MTGYSDQPRDQIFIKRHGYLSFDKNMDKNIVENISENVSSKYSQKRLDYAKQSATDALKTASKRPFQKAEEATDYLIIKNLYKSLKNFTTE